MYDIVGLDMPCVDLNVNVNKFPKPNGGELIRKLSWQGGGKVSSGMTAAARLGAKCAMMGAVGDDILGRFCINDFKNHGIDTQYMAVRNNETTSLSVVISDSQTGGRSIVYHSGSSRHYDFEDINIEILKNTKYFFICNADKVNEKAADIARDAGAKIIADADGYSEAMIALIPKIDLFVASEFVYNAMFSDNDYEKNCREVLKKGSEAVLFTFGEKGCVGVSEQGFFNIPAFNVKAVDTVGAGDVFHGAFVAGLLNGRTVKDAAVLASAVSAIKCTRIGGRAGVPDLKNAERFIETGEIDYTEIDERVKLYERGLENV